MKKVSKNIVRASSLVAMLCGLLSATTACSGGEKWAGSAKDRLKIGVMLYKDNGDDVEALKSWLGEIKYELNIDFAYETGSLTDNDANINAIARLQTNGCQGIVVSQCANTFPSFVDQAAKYQTPIASYYGVPEDYYYIDGRGVPETSMQNMKDYYVGGIEDGVRSGDKGGEYLGKNYFENVVVKAGRRNIGLMHFNFLYYPKQEVAVKTFITMTNEWNAAHADDKIKLFDVGQNEDGTYKTPADFPGKYPGDTSVSNETGNCGWSLGFSPIDKSYFQTGHEGMDTIACFGAAGSFVYPVAVQLNSNVKIYGSGYDGASAGFTEDFGTDGKKIMQQSTFTCVESFAYPLVMLANRIRGNEFKDNYVQKASTNRYLDVDTNDRRVSSYYNYITDSASLKHVRETALYATHKASDALLSAKDINNLMLTHNSNATYDDLLRTVQNLVVPQA